MRWDGDLREGDPMHQVSGPLQFAGSSGRARIAKKIAGGMRGNAQLVGCWERATVYENFHTSRRSQPVAFLHRVGEPVIAEKIRQWLVVHRLAPRVTAAPAWLEALTPERTSG